LKGYVQGAGFREKSGKRMCWMKSAGWKGDGGQSIHGAEKSKHDGWRKEGAAALEKNRSN
jgi:hypothetical protein